MKSPAQILHLYANGICSSGNGLWFRIPESSLKTMISRGDSCAFFFTPCELSHLSTGTNFLPALFYFLARLFPSPILPRSLSDLERMSEGNAV